jgi:hypothetical protein
MMRSARAILSGALGMAGMLAASAFAQGAASPLKDKSLPLPDYSYAGYGFGITPLPVDSGTVIEATAHGVVANDEKDDAKALLRAIAAADAIKGKVTIRLPKGRIQIGEIIPIERSDLVLDGAGAGEDGTEFYFPRPLKIVDTSKRQDEIREYNIEENKYQVEPDQNINFLFTEYSWAGGFIAIGPQDSRPASFKAVYDKRDAVLTNALEGKQFGRQIKVANRKPLKVGQIIQLQWFANAGPDSPILKSIYGDINTWNAQQSDPKMKLVIGQRHWESQKRPTVSQSTRITAIKGNLVTIGDPLLHDIRGDQPAVFANWRHLTNVGVQNIRFTFPMSPWFGHHLEQGYNAIYFTGVFDGWARNLVIENADSAILTDNAASLTIADIITKGEHRAHYSVHIGGVHNVLVKDVRVENPVIHPVTVNTRSTRSVYQRVKVLREPVIDQHSGSNHQNLFDDLTLHFFPNADRSYQLWKSGGAGYWKPGHGLMNTQWNIKVHVEGAGTGAVKLTSGLEGPGAYIVGLSGNRSLDISYAPNPYVEGLNQMPAIPSLYDHQLAQRRKER